MLFLPHMRAALGAGAALRGGIRAAFNAPLITTLVPSAGSGSPTFTRATAQYLADHEGVLRAAVSGEAAFEGARRVRNLVTPTSENLSHASVGKLNISLTSGIDGPNGLSAYRVTPSSSTQSSFYLVYTVAAGASYRPLYALRSAGNAWIRWSDAGGITPAAFQLSDEWFYFSPQTVTSGGVGVIYIQTGSNYTGHAEAVAYDVAFGMVANVSGQSVQAPGEYVSVGVASAPYHGAGVDGSRYFGYANGNTVVNNVVVCEGDSLTSGAFASGGMDYPSQLQDLYAPNLVPRINIGAGGDWMQTIAASEGGDADAYYSAANAMNALVIWAGGNDLANARTPAEVYADLETYCLARQAAGFTVIAGTITPRDVGGASFETNRLALNVLIRAGWADFADALVDFGADSRIGVPGASLDTTYYQADTVHFTDTGYGVVAELVKEQIDALFPEILPINSVAMASGSAIDDATLKGFRAEGARTNLALQSRDLRITHQLTVTGGSGTFTNGETVNAGGGGSGVYRSGSSTSTVYALSGGSGTMTGTLTGATSGATKTISSSVAVWALSDLTAARTATGVDGHANSACTLTATAGNATAVQSITSASAQRVTGCYVKRRTGTGQVEMTQDNGSTWTPIAVTSAWVSVSIAAATAADPTIGLRIVTSGDAIDVDFVMHETAVFMSGPIATTTASATRNANVLSYVRSGNIPAHDFTVMVDWTPNAAAMGTVFLWGSYVDASNYTAVLHDGANVIARKRIAGVNHDATKALAYSKDTRYQIAARFSSTGGVDVFVDSTVGTNESDTTAPQLGSTFQVGSDGNGGNSAYSRLRRFRCYARALTDEQIADFA